MVPTRRRTRPLVAVWALASMLDGEMPRRVSGKALTPALPPDEAETSGSEEARSMTVLRTRICVGLSSTPPVEVEELTTMGMIWRAPEVDPGGISTVTLEPVVTSWTDWEVP